MSIPLAWFWDSCIRRCLSDKTRGKSRCSEPRLPQRLCLVPPVTPCSQLLHPRGSHAPPPPRVTAPMPLRPLSTYLGALRSLSAEPCADCQCPQELAWRRGECGQAGQRGPAPRAAANGGVLAYPNFELGMLHKHRSRCGQACCEMRLELCWFTQCCPFNTHARSRGPHLP